jgi:hypothetical protein
MPNGKIQNGKMPNGKMPSGKMSNNAMWNCKLPKTLIIKIASWYVLKGNLGNDKMPNLKMQCQILKYYVLVRS